MTKKWRTKWIDISHKEWNKNNEMKLQSKS